MSAYGYLGVRPTVIQNVPDDEIFNYEGMSFRKLCFDNLFTYCLCLTDKASYVFFNSTLVTYLKL